MERGEDIIIGDAPIGDASGNFASGGDELRFDDVTTSADGTTVNFASLGNSDGTGTGASDANGGGSSGTGKRRGRKPGTKNGTTNSAQKTPLHIGQLSSTLFSIHAMAAVLLKTQELMITDDEAKILATAFAGVAKYHVNTFDPKKVAYGQLIVALAMVYGTRGVAIRQRKKNEARQAKQNLEDTSLPQNVRPFYANPSAS
jgi:hypothetical protein